ncbi:hypothetical protein ABTN28_19390, partial [Acinetobacter baumannii]
EIGDMIGSNREAANRAVSALLDAGALRFVGKRLEVINTVVLRKEANLDFDWRNHLSPSE